MSFDETVALHNANIFIREFTYSSSLFRSNTGQELELCDGAIWIGDLLILFQNKERNRSHDSGNSEDETAWFNRKVSKGAIKQFHDSLRFLRDERTLPLANLRGQTIDLAKEKEKLSVVHLVALYSPSASLPADIVTTKGRLSQRVGFVHFFHANDYRAVCNTLHTPFEISDYLTFRKAFVTANPAAHTITEKALVGKYLLDPDPSGDINDEHEMYVDRLVNNRDEFSVANLLQVYLDRAISGIHGIEYHAILIELARLRRNMAREFRKRFAWSMEKCKDTAIHQPSRFDPQLGCSFIAIPLPAASRDDWTRHLLSLTHLCKYDFKSPKCVGFTMAPDPSDTTRYVVHWLYIKFEWEPDERADVLLRESNPFRKTTGKMIPLYEFE